MQEGFFYHILYLDNMYLIFTFVIQFPKTYV